MNVCILLLLLVMGCDERGEDTDAATEEAPEGCVDHTWTCAELEAAIASAYGDAELECTDGDETFIFSASGAPLYESTQTTPNEITAQDYRIEIPLNAVCADEAVDVTASRGSIAAGAGPDSRCSAGPGSVTSWSRERRVTSRPSTAMRMPMPVTPASCSVDMGPMTEARYQPSRKSEPATGSVSVAVPKPEPN